MGTFDNLYLNQLKKLQEENNNLRAILNEIREYEGKQFDRGLAPHRVSGPQPGRAAEYIANRFALQARAEGRDLHPHEKSEIAWHAQRDAEYQRNVAAARAARAATKKTEETEATEATAAKLNETIDDYGELEDGVDEIDEPDLPKKTRKQLADEAARSAEWLARKHEEGRKRLLELGFDVHDPKYNLSPSIIKLLTGPR